MKLSSGVFNPGRLRTKVVLASRSIAQDTGGFQTKSPVYVAEVWADWINAHGNEAWVADAQGAIRAATVTIRYRASIDNTYVLIKGATVTEVKNGQGVVTGHTITGGSIYEVVSFDDIQERHEYIEFKLRLVKAG